MSEALPLSDYLDRLGLGHHAPRKGSSACEACGGISLERVADRVAAPDGLPVALGVARCVACGLLMQVPRFDRVFYAEYYATLYRSSTWGDPTPTEGYLLDQVDRGRRLLLALDGGLPLRRSVLDVGCASGGMLAAFAEAGWRTLGYDPDEAAVAHGARRFGLDLRVGSAEEMTVPARSFDLIVVMGSLEHVYDPGATLRVCRRAVSDGGRILLEAHGLGQARQVGAFGQNHRRYLTARSMRAMLAAAGWRPLWDTDAPLCGPTRPGSVFALAEPC